MLAADKQLVVGVENLLPHSGHAELDGEGYANAIIREVFRDYILIFEYAPYARLKRDLTTGTLDIMLLSVPMNFTDADRIIFPKQPIVRTAQVFFVLKGFDWRYPQSKYHGQVALGLTAGLDYPEITSLLHQTKLNYFIEGDRHINRALGLMLNGKLNVYYEDRDAVWYVARQLNMHNQISEAGAAMAPINLFLGIGSHRDDAQSLAAFFDREIVRLHQNGFVDNVRGQFDAVSSRPKN